jgi:phenylalanyl-tRNA synthetase beta chain
MKVTHRWLTEFVDTDLTAAEIAQRLVNAGIEVAEVRPVVEGLAGVVVGEIEAVEQDLGPSRPGHRNLLCRVALPGRTVRVVCGAPNVQPGLRTAVAPPGATLPGGRAIAAAEIRGVVSEGMLCSERELGIGEDAAGILELPPDAPLGADLATYLGLDDTILDIEVTPNRPDALAVVGVAREIAALTGAPFRFPQVTVREWEPDAATQASVEVLDPDLCPRYAARVISGLTVKPSPPWLAQRLRAVGLRPINNVVDVTNYVLWELGHPLHAFDHDTIHEHRIVVRRARPGERLVTLDGRERALTPDMLLIADPDRAIAVGGVMGGAETEVTESTTRVLLEAAYFDPGSIRRTSRALGLATDAAYRFERGADIEGLREAIDRAAQLIADLGRGTVARGVLDAYPSPRPHLRVDLRPERVQRVIGACPPRPELIRILQALGFAVDDSAETLRVVVPSFRRDVTQEEDLIEEVVRIWGYDRIPSALGVARRSTVRRPPHQRLTRAVGRALNAAGLSEVITYAFVDPARLTILGWSDPTRLIALQNPLSRERSALRPSLVPGLLEVLAGNASHQITDARVFEVGHVFAPYRESDGDRPVHEELWVAVAMTGLRTARAWHAPAERVDVYDAKGAAALVLAAAGVRAWDAAPRRPGEAPAYLEPGRGAAITVEGQEIGWFGELGLQVREGLDLAAPVFLAELSLTLLAAMPPAVPRYQPLPRFPAVPRDLAVVVPAGVSAGEVEAAIRALDVPWLARVSLFDVYQGEQVGPGRRSLGWSLTFQAPDRTLTDTEVNELYARIVQEVGKRFDAEVRGLP